MKHKKLLILFFSLCIYNIALSGSKGGIQAHVLQVKDLKNNLQNLDTAAVSSYEHFLDLRMQNKGYDLKIEVPQCEILFETDKYVYYGKVVYIASNGGWYVANKGDNPCVFRYYKTDKKILQHLFPTYDSVQGYHITDILGEKLIKPADESLSRSIGNGNGFYNTRFQYKLTSEGLEVITERIQNTENTLYFTRRFIWRTLFDVNTLAIIKTDTLQYGSIRSKK